MPRFLKIVFFCLFLLLSCSEKNEKEEAKFPVVIENNIQSVSMRTENMIRANYVPLYVGPEKNTLYVNYKLGEYFGPPPFSDDSTEYNIWLSERQKLKRYWIDEPSGNLGQINSSEIKISIDTAKIIKSFNRNIDSAYKAMPVLLINKSTDTLLVGANGYLDITMEAKDEFGKWREIESEVEFLDNFSISSYSILPPKSIILTSAFVYNGDFKTDLRLRLGKHTSSIFKGNINKGQFTRK